MKEFAERVQDLFFFLEISGTFKASVLNVCIELSRMPNFGNFLQSSIQGCQMVIIRNISYRNPKFWYILGGQWNWKFWYLLWPFGILCGQMLYLVTIFISVVAFCYIFSKFWHIVSRKIWQPWSSSQISMAGLTRTSNFFSADFESQISMAGLTRTVGRLNYSQCDLIGVIWPFGRFFPELSVFLWLKIAQCLGHNFFHKIAQS
jgi:hypothetical protein